ncbi:hypothetical protein ES703_33175 [subsurface metagenome]
MGACALCKSDKPLKGSHIIPRFVFDKIKENSATGFLRSVGEVNLRRQDGNKLKMLCEDCEKRFSQAERVFAQKIFEPYQEGGVSSFTYGSWLNYFISSVNWRVLYLDNLDFHTKKEYAEDKLSVLDNAEAILADFLLNKRADIAEVENHIFVMAGPMTASPELRDLRPNVFFRTSAFVYTLFDFGSGGCYVYANLAGILICTVIRKGKQDIWSNTLVQPGGGSINGGQRIASVLMYDMMQLLIERSQIKLSKAQLDRVSKAFNADRKAARSMFFQFCKWDEDMK